MHKNEAARHKNIVLFSDGTGNSVASLFKTNVRRMYEALDLADPQEPTKPRQFAFYDDGVGSSSFRPLAIVGGAIGMGLARNVRELYAFVCRTYAAGDKIYAFGFSRGAFTIRVLVGLMLSQGLVRYNGSEADLERDVADRYRAYRRNRAKGPPHVRLLRAIRDRLTFWRTHVPEMIAGPESAAPLQIEFVGLWDTVDAYGLPVDEMTRAVDRYIWPLTMRDLNLNRRVKRAMHALSLDDERHTFHPRLWNEEPSAEDPGNPAIGVPGGNRATTHINEEWITQVWFAGAHANVGGGYADDSLAHVTLNWIVGEAKRLGLRFSQDRLDKYDALADENGPIFDSRRGLAGYYRYNPRRIDRLTKIGKAKIARAKIHESVLRRIKVGQDGYAPIVLPPGFAVVKIDGAIIEGNEYLGQKIKKGSTYDIQREYVWNYVWWRRVTYFSTLAVTLALVAMPLFAPASPDGVCRSSFCFVSEVIQAVSTFLPGFASTWMNAFSSNPGTFLLLAVPAVLGLWLGGVFNRRVNDAMRPVWYSMPSLMPATKPTIEPVASPGPVNRWVQRLRQSPYYVRSFRFLTQKLLPGLFFILLLYVGIVAVSRVSFAIRDSLGGVCSAGGATPAGMFRTDTFCAATGVQVRVGLEYRLTITIPPDGRWTDNGIPASPNGLCPADVTWPMVAFTPLRRHMTQPWFKLMARVGDEGADIHPLDLKPTLAATCAAEGRATTFTAKFVPRSDGELFLYVNDAVLHFPWLTSFFYANNEGSAEVAVERIDAPTH